MSSKRLNLTVKNFIDTSCDHLDISDILYKEGKYSGSIFHLQQAVEIGSKAFFLCTKLNTEDEIRSKINHYPTKGFQKSVESIPSNIEILSNSSLETLNENFSDITSIEPKMNQATDALSLISKQYKPIPEKELIRFLNQLNSIQTEINQLKIKATDDAYISKDFDEVNTEISHILEKNKLDKKILSKIQNVFANFNNNGIELNPMIKDILL